MGKMAKVLLLFVLIAAPQDERRARKDLYGDPLPTDAVARMGTTQEGG